MVASSPSNHNAPPLEEVVVYRKPSSSESSEEVSPNRAFEQICCCRCSVSCCLMSFGILVIVAALATFGYAAMAFTLDKLEFKTQIIICGSSALSGIVVLSSAILTIVGTTKRSYPILRIDFFFIIGILVYLALKDMGLLYWIIVVELRGFLAAVLICFLTGSWPFLWYVFILILIRRVRRG